MKQFLAYLLFYAIWVLAITYGDRWHVIAEHWQIMPIMLMGSFIAGASAEGGGAIAFPALTLLLETPPAVARDFTFMIQAFGMTAASLKIITMRLNIAWKVMLWAILGGTPGLICGILFIAPQLPPQFTKLFFVSFWLGFGVILGLLSFDANRSTAEHLLAPGLLARSMLLCCGFIGGAVSGITGSGIDIVTFSCVVVAFGLREDIATRTSVILMAVLSVLGFLLRGMTTGLAPQAWNYWYAAVPIVIIGAPLGAWYVTRKGPVFISRMLVAIILVQFIGAVLVIPQSPATIGFIVLITGISLVFFCSLSKCKSWLDLERLTKPTVEQAKSDP